MELNIHRKFKELHVSTPSCDISSEGKETDSLGSAFDSLRIGRDSSNGSAGSKEEDDVVEPFQRLRTISWLEQDIFSFMHKDGGSPRLDSKDEKVSHHNDEESTSKSVTLAFNLPLTVENSSDRSSLPAIPTRVTWGEQMTAEEKPSSSYPKAPTNEPSTEEKVDSKFSNGAMAGLELSSPSLASTSSVRKLSVSLSGDSRMRRRNSTGTLYIDHTMRMQDDKATVRCLCSVIRAHMLEVVENKVPYPREYSTFLDREYMHLVSHRSSSSSSSSSYRSSISNSEAVGLCSESDEKISSVAEGFSKVPSLEDVINTFSYIFDRSQMESECIIITLIYLERLKLATNGKLSIRHENWKSVMLSCIMMASKVWDDLSMLNVDFSKICPSFGLRSVNKLETALLEVLMYEVRVSASCYAKYYFHLRSMMTMLGLITVEKEAQQPLDLNAANRLQLSSKAKPESVEKLTEGSIPPHRTQRCHSIAADTSSGSSACYLFNPQSLNATTTRLRRQRSMNSASTHGRVQLQLEQLVSNSHTDADGLEHHPTSIVVNKEEKTKTKETNSRYGRRRTYHW